MERMKTHDVWDIAKSRVDDFTGPSFEHAAETLYNIEDELRGRYGGDLSSTRNVGNEVRDILIDVKKTLPELYSLTEDLFKRVSLKICNKTKETLDYHPGIQANIMYEQESPPLSYYPCCKSFIPILINVSPIEGTLCDIESSFNEKSKSRIYFNANPWGADVRIYKPFNERISIFKKPTLENCGVMVSIKYNPERK